MTLTHASTALYSQPESQALWFSPSVLGWKLPRRVAYIHRHPQLPGQCLYHWNHEEDAPEAPQSQEIVFRLEDIYTETRGEFAAPKLILDVDLGFDGHLRLISGLSTISAATILSSLCALSPELLRGPITIRLRPGKSSNVVMASLYVDNDWVDGRPLRRDGQGKPVSPIELLNESQTLLKHALGVKLLPHQIRQLRLQSC